MASFSLFFDGPLGFGIQPVDAINADDAVGSLQTRLIPIICFAL
jgi:hypothetical protein